MHLGLICFQIMELAVAEHFLAPVDATKYPVYYVMIEYPMDLNTIKARVENHYYRWGCVMHIHTGIWSFNLKFGWVLMNNLDYLI